jgi:hypothetical protein
LPDVYAGRVGMITIPPRRFTLWLSRQDPIGDLARDVARDPGWPVIAAHRSTYERALIRRGATDAVIDALYQAWAEYEGEGSTAA